MARKIKVDNATLKRLARTERKRVEAVRPVRRYYLIVCEGEKTEPNYFKGLKADLPKGVLEYLKIEIEGTGKNTLSLVDDAQKLKELYLAETGRTVDKLWIVLDRDSFPANDFNGAILKCKNSNPAIGCAWSNEAFELWYLLHFQFYQNAMNRQQYKGLIEQNLRPYLGAEYNYQKNSLNMYQHLKTFGNPQQAIERAQQLAAPYDGQENYANHNPCTMVHLLIEELRTFIKEST